MSDDPPSREGLAILGGRAAFARILPVGQLYFPEWAEYEARFRDIFARQYYTNHGPLVQELEARLALFLGVRHVICVTNATIGLIMAAECMNLKGKVILPSFTFIATAQALSWAKLEPVFCDVDTKTHHITPALVEPHIGPDVSAILAVNLWGGSCDQEGLQELAAKHDLQLFFDSAHAFGCRVNGRPIGSFGAVEAFSFHATKVFSAAEGGCLTTNDDELAKRLRNVRSSYGAGPAVSVVKTSNGRMSEAQAAIALLSLDKIPETIARNKELFDLYRCGLETVDGLHLMEPQNVSYSNYQYIVVDVDETVFGLSRDILLRVLKEENILARRYFFPGAHLSAPYAERQAQGGLALPNTDKINQNIMQLPIGALVEKQDIGKICRILRLAQQSAGEIRRFLEM